MTNDIDASSEAGIDGEVIIETLQVDPDEGTDPLPSGLAASAISQGCQAGGNGQFTNAGRGGLPATPYEPLSSDGIQEDIYPAGQTVAQSVEPNQSAANLIEAQDWGRNSQGNVVLITENSTFHSTCQRTLTRAS